MRRESILGYWVEVEGDIITAIGNKARQAHLGQTVVSREGRNEGKIVAIREPNTKVHNVQNWVLGVQFAFSRDPTWFRFKDLDWSNSEKR